MGLELYLDLLSSPCRAVFIFLEKNQIPFDFQPVNLLQGEHGSSEFASVNSLGRLPTLKDGDFTLKESVAILLYLCREYNTEDHWYPEDGQARARVDEYLSWQHLAIHDLCSKILWLKVLFPYFTDQPVLQNKLDDALAELEANLQQLEEQFLQDQSFIAGDDISLADLVAIVELMQPVGAGCTIFEGRPKLSEWRELVEEAVGKELFREAHDKIMKVQELSGQEADPLLKEKVTAVLQKMM